MKLRWISSKVHERMGMAYAHPHAGEHNFLAVGVEPSVRAFVSPLMCIVVVRPEKAVGDLLAQVAM